MNSYLILKKYSIHTQLFLAFNIYTAEKLEQYTVRINSQTETGNRCR
jgi:hypothetical protein